MKKRNEHLAGDTSTVRAPTAGALARGHTPGPWSLPHFAQPNTDCECGYVLTEEYFGAVCTVHASGEGDWKKTGDNPKYEEACANARLIAAAPELLAALENIIPRFEACCRHTGSDEEFVKASTEMHRAAILKALSPLAERDKGAG